MTIDVTLGGKLVVSHRAQFDVLALCYQKDLDTGPAKAAALKEKCGDDLAVPKTFDQMRDQAGSFANPPNSYGTQYVGKDDAIVGRFYERDVASGDRVFNDEFTPAVNSPATQYWIEATNLMERRPGFGRVTERLSVSNQPGETVLVADHIYRVACWP